MSTITSASPLALHLGTDDQSSAVVYPEASVVPQHIPLVFLNTKKGSTDRQLVTAAEAVLMYGASSFDASSKYYDHQTLFTNTMFAAGQASVVCQRIIPEDAGPKSNIAVYADVLETDVPNYVRNSDGSYKTDANTGAKVLSITTPTVPGYKIKYISEVTSNQLLTVDGKFVKDAEGRFITVDDSSTDYTPGKLTQKTGKMTDGVNTSVMYPIAELQAAFEGEDYNNYGFFIQPTDADTAQANILSDAKVYPYKLGFVNRADSKSSATSFKSLYGEESVMFTFDKSAVNPSTEKTFAVDDIFPAQWFNETDPSFPLKFNDYSKVHMYSESVTELTRKIIETEKAHISAVAVEMVPGEAPVATIDWFDFTTDDSDELYEEAGLINILGAKSSKGTPYFSLIVDEETVELNAKEKEVALSQNTPIFLGGGSDGTIDNASYETQVVKYMQEYLDPDAKVMEMATNPESIIYDSGFKKS